MRVEAGVVSMARGRVTSHADGRTGRGIEAKARGIYAASVREVRGVPE